MEDDPNLARLKDDCDHVHETVENLRFVLANVVKQKNDALAQLEESRRECARLEAKLQDLRLDFENLLSHEGGSE